MTWKDWQEETSWMTLAQALGQKWEAVPRQQLSAKASERNQKREVAALSWEIIWNTETCCYRDYKIFLVCDH